MKQNHAPEPTVYRTGNPWQRKVFSHMADYLVNLGITEFGVSEQGNHYKHLLTKEQGILNFITPDIYDKTEERFNSHKAGNLNRVLTNTAASQGYCFNLMIYLRPNVLLANSLFSLLLGKPVKVHHIV